ncbi:DUF4328 domain-containing protein [Cellulosimicrobium sp. CUA-896]|uniref:DUF4328 domain-containing protein n=1 Tax=Cellulosimicrobium sp. CUA-896 TaxID=1517881 RepID=UPI000962D431|nr:DUF4328 domain-containing protein [Cellulosimicrobium sp. CUA-896]OLT46812.1 hypothetical protein BJF88_04285 [Cellulosimicrobium sp. CUA-896]
MSQHDPSQAHPPHQQVPTGPPPPAYGQHAPPPPAYGRYAPLPTGYANPGAPWGGPGPSLRVPSGLATATVVLTVAVTVVQVLSWLTSFGAADEYARAARLGVPSVEVFTAYDTVALLLLPLQLAAAVVTCVWLWTSRRIAETVAPGWHHARSRVWVWLGWLVPVVAYWFPYQVVRDVRGATTTVPRAGLGWWWAGWLVYLVATNVTAQVSASASSRSGDVFSTLPVVETLGTAGAVVAVVLWVRTVREITAGQRAALSPASW